MKKTWMGNPGRGRHGCLAVDWGKSEREAERMVQEMRLDREGGARLGITWRDQGRSVIQPGLLMDWLGSKVGKEIGE